MKVVFDTNVYVSALVLPGSRADIALQRIIGGQDQLLLSRPILAELLDVLARKFSRDAEELSRVALFLDDLGTIVETSTIVNQLADEPTTASWSARSMAAPTASSPVTSACSSWGHGEVSAVCRWQTS